MHRCSSNNNNSSSQGNIVGPCTCDLFHSQTNSFSMLFSMPNHNKQPFDEETEIMYSSSSSSSSSSSVDCTLSLGTPSTRLSDEYSQRRRPTTPINNNNNNNNNNNSYMSNFCWDILHQSNKHSSSNNYSSSAFRNSRGGGNSSNASNVSDPLVARRCANCDTTSTPLWRNGPRGPKSLCNACGIRFKKEERRASAAAATTTTTTNGGAGGGVMMDAQAQHMMINSHHHNNNNNAWAHHHLHSQQTQKMACLSPAIGNEFRFIDEDDDRDSDTGIPFLSWRLNVTDRPTSLVHDFTR